MHIKVIAGRYLLGLFFLLGLGSASLHAAPPAQQRDQAPGFYRMALGDFEVTALYDGAVNLDPALLKGVSADDVQALLARMFNKSNDGVQTAVNAYLVHTGKHLVLVDAGAAQCFGSGLGHILPNIEASGYRAEDVDLVLLTHLHPDHSCGLVGSDGKAAFSNARVRVTKAEAGFWLNPEAAKKAPEDSKAFFTMSRDAVAPYKEIDRFETFEVGETLIPGVKVVSTPGHTPGHVSYLFESGDQSLLVWGDIIHSHAVQFARPEVSIEFDVDEPQAIETRQRVLAEAAADKLWIAGAHLPFPGLGHVRPENRGYSWVPVEYSPMPAAK
ncbi:MBL fold metallo-hydrolase [Hydrocarboniclastica marina]|uniref:MBL fold metallo-hydrolase n=1 Tax=Hydrocarboniclastica marina TaxID=2259620 RepID=A0A4P7XK07_9ALTE|nr:MBL fold metallo-hydrolase [Hydrocarboniclastica marina]QCF27113.1 MBL fold metallo-hydrolase [Hydrocarboniclastica marina]